MSHTRAGHEKGWYQGQQILKPVGSSTKYNYSDGEAREILLILEVLVGSHEDVVVTLRQPKERPVLLPGPRPVVDRLDVDARKVLRQASRERFVKK